MHTRQPLIEALKLHSQASPVSFHVPGHKNGRLFQNDLSPLVSAGVWDQTEIKGLDDLYRPHGPLYEAQDLLSDLYGTRASYLLTGGSTAGNLVMLYLASLRGEKVLIQRNSHQSILHGLELFNLTGVYLETDREAVTGVPLGVAPETITDALNDHPDAVMVIFTHPTYEGYGGQLKELLKLAKKRGVITAVDEAHGAHFAHSSLPDHAIDLGADIAVQSAHKMLPALTMGAWLHLGETAPWHEDEVRRVVQMLQSSSPSYLIMASLDAARSTLATLGEQTVTRQIEHYEQLEHLLIETTGATVMPRQLASYHRDPFKLPLATASNQESKQWKQRLEKLHAYPELHGAKHLLLTLPLFDGERETAFLRSNRADLFGNRKPSDGPLPFRVIPPEISWTWVNESLNTYTASCRLPLDQAAGHISAETITPYPPGVPVVQTGRKITQEQMNRILEAHRSGVAFQTGDHWINQGILVYRMAEGDDNE